MILRPDIIRQQIANLLLQYPELAEDEILRADMIEGETEAFDFLRIVERQRQDAASRAQAITFNVTELGVRQARFERREKGLRDLARKIMEAAGLRSIEMAEATYSIRRVPPKVVITDETVLPPVAFKTVLKPDMAKIKELLTDETGVCAGAIMSNGSETLSIRIK